MLHQLNLSEFIPQSIRCLKVIRESFTFFKKNELWRGIFQHKWILLITVIISVLFSYTLFSNLYDFMFNSSEPLDLGLINTEEDSSGSKNKNRFTAISGGSKFLLLVLLEVVIFHFSVKTLEILNNEKYQTNFNMFLKAEFRMLKVMIRSAIQSAIVHVILYIVLGIAGMDIILPACMYLVHSFFIGLAFFDKGLIKPKVVFNNF